LPAIWAAPFALYLVLEGILPFVKPGRPRSGLMAKLANTEPAQLRWGGIDQHGGGTWHCCG